MQIFSRKALGARRLGARRIGGLVACWLCDLVDACTPVSLHACCVYTCTPVHRYIRFLVAALIRYQKQSPDTPKSSFGGDEILSVRLQNPPRGHQNRAKIALGGSRGAQEYPRAPQERPRWTQVRLSWSQVGPESAQVGRKLATRAPKLSPRGSKLSSRIDQNAPS